MHGTGSHLLVWGGEKLPGYPRQLHRSHLSSLQPEGAAGLWLLVTVVLDAHQQVQQQAGALSQLCSVCRHCCSFLMGCHHQVLPSRVSCESHDWE